MEGFDSADGAVAKSIDRAQRLARLCFVKEDAERISFMSPSEYVAAGFEKHAADLDGCLDKQEMRILAVSRVTRRDENDTDNESAFAIGDAGSRAEFRFNTLVAYRSTSGNDFFQLGFAGSPPE